MSNDIPDHDFHVHVSSVDSLEQYVINLSELIRTERNRRNVVDLPTRCICNHHYTFDKSIFEDLSERFGIYLPRSIGFFTKEGFHFNLIEPKNNNCETFINKLMEENKSRTFKIIRYLHRHQYVISLKSILSRYQKKVHEVNMYDIATELLLNEFVDNYKDAMYISLMAYDKIPRIYFDLKTVVKYLIKSKFKHLSIVEPDKYLLEKHEDYIQYLEIDSFVTKDVENASLTQDTEYSIYPGSNSFVY